ncbi:hypothetical protein WICPIJ_001256 [Wickerhamomyces pijperi]|uniref:Uncharacterized protein n=1 Tax=Wickerhamomyces pijperi TaxID=599730 RepID=A0A9P8QEC3_WICPI|nr:hypothetical protein WICPIJ_001256 [Wickerhamomyces pijperi]
MKDSGFVQSNTSTSMISSQLFKITFVSKFGVISGKSVIVILYPSLAIVIPVNPVPEPNSKMDPFNRSCSFRTFNLSVMNSAKTKEDPQVFKPKLSLTKAGSFNLICSSICSILIFLVVDGLAVLPEFSEIRKDANAKMSSLVTLCCRRDCKYVNNAVGSSLDLRYGSRLDDSSASP